MELDTGIETKEQVVDKAASIAYDCFRKQKWTYWTGAPDRNYLKHTIEQLIVSAEQYEMASTGRIVVHKVEDDGFNEISIMLDLGSYCYEKDWDK